MNRLVRKAVLPAAGLGTRFLPATKATPKELLPLVDRPAIQYVVKEAVAAGLHGRPARMRARRSGARIPERVALLCHPTRYTAE